VKAEYQFNAHRNKAEIIFIDDCRDTCLVMTVAEAATVVASLSEAISEAFYDFTASTPNRDSPVLKQQDSGENDE